MLLNIAKNLGKILVKQQSKCCTISYFLALAIHNMLIFDVWKGEQ